MARVTVEDCIDKVDNRFDLILLAAHRARELSVGASATLDINGEKMPVVALRELAADNIKADDLKASYVKSLQTFVEREEPKPAPVVEQPKKKEPIEVSEDKVLDTKFTLSIQTMIAAGTGLASLIGMWYTLQGEIEEAKELPKIDIYQFQYLLFLQVCENFHSG